MIVTTEQKKELKKVLFDLATPEEKRELNSLDAVELNERLDKIVKYIADFMSENKLKSQKEFKNISDINSAVAALSNSINVFRNSSSIVSQQVSDRMEKTFENLTNAFNEKLDQLKKAEVTDKVTANFIRFSKIFNDKLEELKQVRGNSQDLTVPLYKGMIEEISKVNESVQRIPTPVWRWPQYAAVSVRNKNFANINPAISPFGIEDYDDVQLSYSGSNLIGVDYLLNGKVVAVLTLSYSGSNLTEVKRTQ